MGSVIGTAAEKVGGVLGNTITAPFRKVFSKSCEDKCGAWDVWCSIENACGASLVRLFVAYARASLVRLFVAYALVIMTNFATTVKYERPLLIVEFSTRHDSATFLLVPSAVLFLYVVLWKTGLAKCLVKKSCKLLWKAFWGCFRALGGACGCLWHKLRDTRRVYRGREDVEMGDLGWSDTDESRSTNVGSRKRGRSPVLVRERRKDRLRQSLRPTSRQISKVEHPVKRSRTEWSLHHHHRHRATALRRTEASSSSLCVHSSTRHDHGCVHGAREH